MTGYYHVDILVNVVLAIIMFGLGLHHNQYTIAIEVGLHNTALALLVAGTIIKSAEMEKPALVYAMFTFFSSFLFIFVIKGKHTFK